MPEREAKGHILIVDDDETIINVVSTLLQEQGYSIYPALSGAEALEIFASEKVDLVITDICMDGMDGFELMKRLQLVDSSINVIVMTGFDSYDKLLTALQLGAYDYLQKPLDNHTGLVAAVDRAYSNAVLTRENRQLVLQLENSHEKLSKANKRLVEANQKLKRLAATDGLTLLFNRRYFDQILQREADRRNRYKLPLSIAMLDIDHFKLINDTYGHEAGDNALKQIAAIITECARTADIVARYGGEEFVIVLPQTDAESATVFAERVRSAIENADFDLLNNVKAKLTVSLGIAGVQATDDAVSAQSLIAKADRALYQAKEMGRNRFELATEIYKDDNKKAA